MSAITIESDLVHYEVLGRGRPVIFLHGWLGSWRFWVPTMQQLSLKYRTYALDMWGFGDSGKDANRYGLREQVQLLFGFYERLGVPKAALIGHSFGAAVALSFAQQYPDRVHRLMLISPPPLEGSGVPAANAPVSTATANTTNNATPPAPSAAPTGSGNNPAGITANPTPPPAQYNPLADDPFPSRDPRATGTQYSSTSETIPRNPFRTRGESPEDIMARLRASRAYTGANPLNPATSGGSGGANEPPANPYPPQARPAAPVLPTSIATPILPAASPFRVDENNPLIAALTGAKPGALFLKYVSRDVPDLETLRTEADKADEQALIRSAQSLAGTNLAAELKRLVTPTLLLHGEDDAFMQAPSDETLRRIAGGKPAGSLLTLVQPQIRHFPMLEESSRFNRLLLDFFEAPDLANIQFKDQWRRAMR